MRSILVACTVIFCITTTSVSAQSPAPAEPYRVLKTVKVGGEGGYDYVYADASGRRLYVPRQGPGARVSVFDLDTLAPAGELAGVRGQGVAVDAKSHHGFASSKPVAMWDTKSLAPSKTIDVQGFPDGILGDPSVGRIYVLSHTAPNVTVINAADGSVAGTIDLGGAPEQAASDGKGHLFVDVEDKNQVAVVDAKTLTKTGAYDLGDKCGTPAGLAMDTKTHVLFVACRAPAVMAMLNSDTGKILAVLPIGVGVDGAAFNPATREAFSSQGDGTLTVIKELGPTEFVVEQTVQTPPFARTLTLDSKTGRILLITGEFGPPPETPSPAPGAPPARPRRGPMLPNSFSIVVVGR
jgi:DNA-binding beta-propeller fold protein YncE